MIDEKKNNAINAGNQMYELICIQKCHFYTFHKNGIVEGYSFDELGINTNLLFHEVACDLKTDYVLIKRFRGGNNTSLLCLANQTAITKL